MSVNLVVHAGGSKVERNALALVEVPATTRSYCPVRHDMLADLIEDKLADVGFRFGDQAHALARNGNQYFGVAELLSGTGNDQYALVGGWRSSYDMSLSAEFVVGSQVFVCDNLAFSGEIQIARKHTTNIMRDLPMMVTEAVSRTSAMAKQQGVRYERYQSAQLKDSIANHTIIQMLRLGVINTQRVEKVVQEYYEPSHPEHLINGKRTNWTLFNAATEALKGVGLATLPKRTVALHDLMDKATEYALAA